ncbi:hypothetical protein G4B88_005005 [Cannabis sativa]|uniref:Uncharacterized protein n=1 Tax=Cannabis sativa TaxID=3483 RepID=A0A7J6H4D8_CANSA|nr:hypothetical protein G4B88_005005 [Cannabis sativa]
MDDSLLKLISDTGTKLTKRTNPNKDFIVKSLRSSLNSGQAANALSQLEQPSSPDPNKKLEAAREIEAAIEPLKECIIIRGLLQHKDNDVKLLVAICVSETFRILAPDLPFEDKYLRGVFELIISMFAELADTTSPYFSRRVKILETVSRCKCCVIMLDIDCNDLIMEMFTTFFSVVREHHQQSLINDILSIMTDILNEEVTQLLLDVILHNLLKEEKGFSDPFEENELWKLESFIFVFVLVDLSLAVGFLIASGTLTMRLLGSKRKWNSIGEFRGFLKKTPSAACQLAMSVIKTSAEKLGPIVCEFLTSCIMNRDAVQSENKEFYHEIIFKIAQCAPHMLHDIIPNMSQELLTDQVDVRIKALTLIGKLLSLPEFHIAQNYRNLFMEFLKRFVDISAEVRVTALQCAKICYMTNPTGTESHEVLSALEGRLLDIDDRVRVEAVSVACDLARSNLKTFSRKLISQTIERLRDKKISVREKTLDKLLEVYRDYCNACSEGRMTICDELEKIPCKLFMLYYDKDCKAFRPQNMELILVKDLFPALLSAEERTRHWVHLFSLFKPLHVKSLNLVLYQKGRLQNEMQTYLAFRAKEKDYRDENCSNEKCTSSFKKMAESFADPSKAEKCFEKLNDVKENKIFNFLETLLKDLGHVNAETTRNKLLNLIGDKSKIFEFVQTLSLKCSHNIFSSGHVRCILDNLSSDSFGDKHYKDSSLQLLLVITNIFPKLLRGSEENSAKVSEIYPFLKSLCLEGTRLQSKFAVSAIATLIDTSKETELCKELVESLHCGRNTSTVLQSLGCLAQHSVSTFEAHDGEITPFIYEKILQVDSTETSSSSDDSLGCSDSCKLKICGLKTLVKSFLPHRGAKVRRNIKELLDRLLIIMRNNDACRIWEDEDERNESFLRLAAAKSVLRLSQRWDFYISPEIFSSTISMAKDGSYSVRRSFLDKTHTMLKKRAIPSRYACIYALASCLEDLREDSYKYMAEFVKEYGREARQTTGDTDKKGLITDFPAYIVVFLIHFLAHNKDFPLEDCRNEDLYAHFCSPLFSVLQALLNAINFDDDVNEVKATVSYLVYIFRAIKRVEDAVNIKNTSKLHILADIGLAFVIAVNQSGISVSSSHILLPSSLYRANTGYVAQSCLDEDFVKRVIDKFKSHSSLVHETNPSKRGRKHKGDCSQSAVIRDRNLNFPLSKIGDLPISKSAETEQTVKQGTATGGRRKQAAASMNGSGSAQLHECSKIDHHIDPSGKSESNHETEHIISSSGSVPVKPPVAGSRVSTRNMKRNVASLKVSGGGSSNSGSEDSKLNQAKLKDSCSLKKTTDTGEALIGKRIKLLSPIERCFYAGTVDSYNSENNTHKIACDNGTIDLLCLDSESWETIGDDAQHETVMPAENPNALQLQCRDRKKPTDTHSKAPARPSRNVGKESGEANHTAVAMLCLWMNVVIASWDCFLYKASSTFYDVFHWNWDHLEKTTKSQKAWAEFTDTNENMGLRRSQRRKG